MRHYLIALCVIVTLALFAEPGFTGETIPPPADQPPPVYLPIVSTIPRWPRDVLIQRRDIPDDWEVLLEVDRGSEYYIAALSPSPQAPLFFQSRGQVYPSPQAAGATFAAVVAEFRRDVSNFRQIPWPTIGDRSALFYWEFEDPTYGRIEAAVLPLVIDNLYLEVSTYFDEGFTYDLIDSCSKLIAQRAEADVQGSCDLSRYDGRASE
jgi:hypothetical protein